MRHGSYLLVIDNAPIESELTRYFSQFDVTIALGIDLNALNNALETPSAVLIHWSFLKQNLHAIPLLMQKYPVPFIALYDLHDQEICIAALEAGADDFIAKPIPPRTLHARINAIQRRMLHTQKEALHGKSVYLFSGWRLYPASRQVFDERKREVRMSTGEYNLLLVFVQQPHRILDRELLLNATKNSHLTPFDRRIDVQISRLRTKIEPDAKKPSLIQTIRNRGYLFTAKVELIQEPLTD